MKVPIALALPNGLTVSEIEIIDEFLTLTVVSVQMRACCPLCDVCPSRVHSRCIRRLTDLPSARQRECLLVCVGKFFYLVSTCARKIFTECLTPFVKLWARVTRRLYQIVQSLVCPTAADQASVPRIDWGDRCVERQFSDASWRSHQSRLDRCRSSE